MWHDRPIDDECVKTCISELRIGNKKLVKEIMLLKNENKVLTKMIAKLKTATLKAKIEVTIAKLKFSMLE